MDTTRNSKTKSRSDEDSDDVMFRDFEVRMMDAALEMDQSKDPERRAIGRAIRHTLPGLVAFFKAEMSHNASPGISMVGALHVFSSVISAVVKMTTPPRSTPQTLDVGIASLVAMFMTGLTDRPAEVAACVVRLERELSAGSKG